MEDLDTEEFDTAAYLACAKTLVVSLEANDITASKKSLDNLIRLHETDLFRELGKLTRELHEALSGFQLDSDFSNLAQKDIPDARERLNYVITMTDDAAHKTLNAIEACFPIANKLESDANQLHDKWVRFRHRDMGIDEFRELSIELDHFLTKTTDNSTTLQTKLNEVLMAQGFQDLSGQIIRRVINLVQDVENNMVNLIRLSGQAITSDTYTDTDTDSQQNKEKEAALEGPLIPGIEVEGSVSGQDDVDDLLSSLGF